MNYLIYLLNELFNSTIVVYKEVNKYVVSA